MSSDLLDIPCTYRAAAELFTAGKNDLLDD